MHYVNYVPYPKGYENKLVLSLLYNVDVIDTQHVISMNMYFNMVI